MSDANPLRRCDASHLRELDGACEVEDRGQRTEDELRPASRSAILAVGAEKSLGQEHADRHARHEDQRFRPEGAQVGE